MKIDKVISSFPISIGTALALESLFEGRLPPYDPNREIPEQINPDDYQEIWFNVSTMFRNLVRAANIKDFVKYKPRDLYLELQDEIFAIHSVVSEDAKIAKAVFYWPDYKKIGNSFIDKKVPIRVSHTPAQIEYSEAENKTRELIFDPEAWIKTGAGIVIQQKIVGYSTSKLVFTHYNYDLADVGHYRKMDLLESHTGKRVTQSQLSKRYYPVPNEDMSHLPFNLPLLITFGDRSMFKPHSIQLRREMMEVSKKAKWTPMTRTDRVISDIKRYLSDTAYADWISKFK